MSKNRRRERNADCLGSHFAEMNMSTCNFKDIFYTFYRHVDEAFMMTLVIEVTQEMETPSRLRVDSK